MRQQQADTTGARATTIQGYGTDTVNVTGTSQTLNLQGQEPDTTTPAVNVGRAGSVQSIRGA